MTRTSLSQRLQAVANYVPAGSRLLDVGSDHAYLPLYLLEQGKITYAIAGEVVQGPYQSALANAQASPFSHLLDVRLADGLAAVEPNDGIDTITICGMGGRLIAEILDKGKARLSSVQRLVLQPNNREDDLRLWLSQNGYMIMAEDIVEDKDKIYELILAVPGHQALSALDIRFGPILRQSQSPIFVSKWQRERDKLEEALAGIPVQHTEARSAMCNTLNTIKEVLHES